MSTPSTAPSEMAFFSLLARWASLSATARELGISTAAASKRLAQMESRLGVQLVSRTTRRLHLTAEGNTYLQHARRILAEIDAMEQLVSDMQAEPQGLLRVNATLGFGRSHIAPLVPAFVRRHPQIQLQLQLSVQPPPLADDGFDVCIRFGEPPEARMQVLFQHRAQARRQHRSRSVRADRHRDRTAIHDGRQRKRAQQGSVGHIDRNTECARDARYTRILRVIRGG